MSTPRAIRSCVLFWLVALGLALLAMSWRRYSTRGGGFEGTD